MTFHFHYAPVPFFFPYPLPPLPVCPSVHLPVCPVPCPKSCAISAPVRVLLSLLKRIKISKRKRKKTEPPQLLHKLSLNYHRRLSLPQTTCSRSSTYCKVFRHRKAWKSCLGENYYIIIRRHLRNHRPDWCAQLVKDTSTQAICAGGSRNM